MSGILWASLGVALGILVPVVFRLRQRGASSAAETVDNAEPGSRARSAAPGSKARRSDPSQGSAPANQRKQANKFHGITIRPGLEACQAVLAVTDRRFLPQEAPTLPLPGCDVARCQCGYRHHSDRRERRDRRSGWGTFGGYTPTVAGGDRRDKSPDRRKRKD